MGFHVGNLYPDRKDFNIPPSLTHARIYWLYEFSELCNLFLMMVIFGVCLENQVTS
jgi:hypothetical protein